MEARERSEPSDVSASSRGRSANSRRRFIGALLGAVLATLPDRNAWAWVARRMRRHRTAGGGAPVAYTLWAWGSGSVGRLGNEATSNQSSPTQVPGSWIAFSAGGDHSLGIRNDGTLWAWGEGTYYRLGQSVTTDRSSPVQVPGSWTACAAGGDDGNQYGHSLALRSDGTLWAWGFGGLGALGDGSSATRSSPVQVLGSWIAFTAGGRHSAGITQDRTLWCWGNNEWGQLGIGNTSNQLSPVQVPGSWIAISCGDDHSLGIRTDSTLWAWGQNIWGLLGDGTSISRSSPVQVSGSWTMCSAADSHSLGIRTDGTLWAWGLGSSGALANNGSTQSSPIQVPGSWTTCAAGGASGSSSQASYAIRTDGTLWAWGAGLAGRLGIGVIGDRSSPMQVPGSWIAVSAARTHTMGIR